MNKVSDYMWGMAQYMDYLSDRLTWDPMVLDDPEFRYPDGVTGIVMKDVPMVPDRIVTITPYLDHNMIVVPTREITFQLRTRGGRIPTDCDDIADECISILHGKHHLVWRGLEIARIRHIGLATSLGPDDQARWERTDNYELLTQRRV